MAETETCELFKRYRPRKISEIVGQKDALKMLIDMDKRNAIPHALLMSGPSGTGKTTIARILARRLKCSPMDFCEINGSSSRGIDTIRDIERAVSTAPIGGTSRVWYIDESHALTGDAQNSILKLLEDMPPHVYFMLATTDPKKLKPTILTRCTQIVCKAISIADLKELIDRVVLAEEKTLDSSVVDLIASTANGSARQALVTLHTVIGLVDKESQIAAIQNPDVVGTGIELARLLYNPKSTWQQVAGILKTNEEDPEGIRRIIVGYGKAILLNSGAARAHMVIEEFREPLFDVGTAAALLASSCFAIINSR